MRHPRLGLTVLAAWVAGQVVWLQHGYQLEFLGRSKFVPGLWQASLLFFGVNCWVLGIVVRDIARGVGKKGERVDEKSEKRSDAGGVKSTSENTVDEKSKRKRQTATNERTKAMLRSVR